MKIIRIMTIVELSVYFKESTFTPRLNIHHLFEPPKATIDIAKELFKYTRNNILEVHKDGKGDGVIESILVRKDLQFV